MNVLTRINAKIPSSLTEKEERAIVAVVTVLLLPLFLIGIRNHTALITLPDELGYIAPAAYLRGYDWSGVLGVTGYYSYFLTIVYYPLFLLLESPTAILNAGILFNCIMSCLLFPISYYFGKKIAPSMNMFLLMAISLCAILFHANIVFTRILMAESMLIFMFWLLCFCISRVNSKSHYLLFASIGLLLSSTYIMHQRTISVLIAGLVVIALMRVLNKITTKQALLTVGIAAVVVLTHELYLKPLVQAHLYVRDTSNIAAVTSGSSRLRNDYDSVFIGVIHTFSTIEGITSMLRTFVGQLFAFGTTTALLGYVGVVYLSISCFSEIKKIRKKDAETGEGLYIKFFILLSFLMSLGVSAISMARPARLDHIVYERYMYNIIGPVISFALIKMFSAEKKSIGIVLCSIATYLGLGIALYFIVKDFPPVPFYGTTNAIGTNVFYTGNRLNIPLTFFVAAFTISVLNFTTRYGAKVKSIALLALAVVFAYVGVDVVANRHIPSAHYAARLALVANEIKKNYNHLDLYISQEVSHDSLRIQHFLMDKPAIRLRGNETVDLEDYLLLSTKPNIEVLNTHRAYSSVGGILFLRPGITPPMYEYAFSNNDIFYYEGFSYFEDSFRWAINGNSNIYMHLDENDYVFNIHHLGLPHVILGIRELSFSFYLNENLLASFDGEYVANSNTIEMDVLREYVVDGVNTFAIKYDSWSPIEYGSLDDRQLGIGIFSIEAIPIGDS